MLKHMVAAIVVLGLLSGGAGAADWTIDKAHSSINFSVRHLVISKTNGRFHDFDGEISFDGENWDKANAEMTVKIASIDTDNKDRDDHLRSPDFFDAAKYPDMVFKSKKVVKGEGKRFQLIGDLTIKDVTREVTFDCEFHGIAEFMGTKKAGFTAQAKIDRKDFGMTWNKVLDAGGVAVGNEVTITLEIEADMAG